MLTKIVVKNFKSLEEIEISDFSDTVVLVGPNNCGKTSILQALALWHLAAQKIIPGVESKKRPGTPITRKEIFALPIKDIREIWTDLRISKQSKKNYIEIGVEVFLEGKKFDLFVKFEHFNEELIYASPVKDKANSLLAKQGLIKKINIAFLPPMSGLKALEEKLVPETIDARIGEGRTAEVLRNICYLVLNPETEKQKGGRNPKEDWNFLSKIMKEIFMIELYEPEIDARGEIELNYSRLNSEEKNRKLEISSAGRGMQQILLLLSYFLLKPQTTLLLDEPDAHLEILKQERIYNLLKEIAREKGSQIIATSHSEVVLREAIGEDSVVAFFPASKPYYIGEKEKKHLELALREIEPEHLFLAKHKGWVLYLEGSTDLDILRAFAKKLGHEEAQKALSEVFVHYVADNVNKANNHFFNIRSALKNSKTKVGGIAIFDRTPHAVSGEVAQDFSIVKWQRYEIENYFFCVEALLGYASRGREDLFDYEKIMQSKKIMEEILSGMIPPDALRNPSDEFWTEQKASDWLTRILQKFYQNLGVSSEIAATLKNRLHELVEFMPLNFVDEEVTAKLDMLVKVSKDLPH